MTNIDIKSFDSLSTEKCYDIDKIQKFSVDNLTYDHFFHEFMLKNIPVIINDVKITTPSSVCWFANGKFDIDILGRLLGDHEVPVSNCSSQYYDSHEKTTMKFSDYIKFWKSERVSPPTGLFYLKDFHLKQEFPEIDFYNVPEFFASDWLNEYLIDRGKGDYRFIYIGPKDSW